MTGYVLLVIELAAILVVLVGLALFLGWVLGKRSARAKLAAEQETRPTRPTPELEAMAVLKDDKKEPVSLASRAVPVEAQPAASQPPSPIAVASYPFFTVTISSLNPRLGTSFLSIISIDSLN